MAAPIGILGTVEAGFQAVNNIASGLTLLATEIKRGNDNSWFQQKADAFKPLESGPTTGAQKDEAAKDIGNLISKL